MSALVARPHFYVRVAATSAFAAAIAAATTTSTAAATATSTSAVVLVVTVKHEIRSDWHPRLEQGLDFIFGVLM